MSIPGLIRLQGEASMQGYKVKYSQNCCPRPVFGQFALCLKMLRVYLRPLYPSSLLVYVEICELEGILRDNDVMLYLS